MNLNQINHQNLREVPINTIIITSKGFKFQLINRKNGKEVWLDLISGVIWYDIEDEKYTYDQAVSKFKDSLPMIEEFRVAEEHGFREVLPNMKDKWFWSSSVDSFNTRDAWEFYGNYGNTGLDFRDFSDSVRCVGGRFRNYNKTFKNKCEALISE